MPIDRGGLDYPIRVGDEFSSTFAKFKKDASDARAEWRKLRDEMAKEARASTGSKRGASEAVKQAREERQLAVEKLRSERQIGREKEKSAQDDIRRSIERRRLTAQEERAVLAQIRNERRLQEEVFREKQALIKAEITARKQARQAEVDVARQRQQLAEIERKAEATRLKSIESAQKAERKAYSERLKNENELSRIAESRAAIAERAAAREQRAATRQIAAVNKRLDLEERLQFNREQRAARSAERAARAEDQRLKAQAIGVEQIFRDQEKTRALQKKVADDETLRLERLERARAVSASRAEKAAVSLSEQQRRAGVAQLLDEEKLKRSRISTADAVKRSADQQKRFKTETEGTESAGSRLLFTFRRLFGVLAIFTIVRKVTQYFLEAVAAVFQFNSKIESATLGIQSILAASSEISTVYGRVLTDAEKFAAANSEARRQVALLRVEGLKTAATFDQLLEAYQSALGPGLAAGLSPDQIRQFAVRIAQAAAAIGVPQNQLTEEIRSILSGTIQQRTTRIAAVLGITNADIKRMKEAGTLADFLFDRFKAFAFAGEESLATFSVIVANLKDGVGQLLGEGGKDFFDQIKGGLKGVLDLLVQTTDKGVLINPEAVRIVQAVFSVLQRVAQLIRAIFSGFSLEGAAEQAEVISATVQSIIKYAEAFGRSFVDAFSGVLLALSEISQFVIRVVDSFANLGVVGDFMEIIFSQLGAMLGLVTALKVSWFAISGILSVSSKLAYGLVVAFKAVRFVANGITTAIFALNTALTPIGVAFVAVAAVIGAAALVLKNDFIRSIEIGGLKIGTWADLIKVNIVNQFEKAWVGLKYGAEVTADFFGDIFRKAIHDIEDAWNAARQLFYEAGELLGIEGAAKKVQEIEDQRRNADLAYRRDRDRRDLEHQEALNKLKREFDEDEAALLAKERAILLKDAEGPRRSISEALREIKGNLLEILGLQDQTNDSTTDGVALADQFVETWASLPPIISQINKTLEDQGDTLQKLRDNIDDARQEFSTALAVEGLSGVEAGIIKEQAKSFREISIVAREFSAKIKETNNTIETLSAREREVTKEILNQSRISEDQLDSLLRAGRELNELASRDKALQAGRKAAAADLEDAVRSGIKTDREAAEERLRLIDEEIKSTRLGASAVSLFIQQRIESLNLSKVEGESLLQQTSELLRLGGERIANEEALKKATSERGRVEDLVNTATIERIRALVVEDRQRLRIAALRAQSELESARAVQQASRITSGIEGQLGGVQNQARRDAAAAGARLRATQLQTEELALQFELQKRALEIEIARQSDAVTRGLLQERLNVLQEEFNANLEKAKVDASEITLEIARLKAILDEPAFTGFQAGLEEFAAKATDTFSAFKDFAIQSVEGIAGVLSDSITEALDPTAQKKGLLTRFNDFMNQVFALIVNSALKLAIVKAILEPLGLIGGAAADPAAAEAAAATAIGASVQAAASAALAQAALAEITAIQAASIVGGASGFAKGGLIGRSATRAATGHFRAPQGLAAGGQPIRPKGLHPSDTVPIWAAIGEFMQPVRAVRAYGVGVMEAIRQQRIDPNLLRALAGVHSAHTVRTRASRGPGFAVGGGIGKSSGAGFSADQIQLTILNVSSREEVLSALADRQGQDTIVNVARARANDLRPAT